MIQVRIFHNNNHKENEGNLMYTVDFSKPIHVHFIGIGGISMSGLAGILLQEGFTISGSDAKESELTDHGSSEQMSFTARQQLTSRTESILWSTLQRFIRTIRNTLPQSKGSSHADKSSASGTDHVQLQNPDRCIRHSRKNHHYFTGFPCSDGR